MAPSRKRTRAVAEEQNASKQTMATQQKNIKTFASVKKTKDADIGAKKRKTSHYREPTPPVTKSASEKEMKRKRSLDSVAEESDDEASAPETTSEQRIFAQFARKRDDGKGNKRAKHATLPPSPRETPSKRAAKMFDNLKLDAKPIPCALGKISQAGLDTPPETPEAEKAEPGYALPIELQELAQMHASFLTALSLYYAHNGTSSPANISSLLPQITKSYRKRAVTLEDLRRIFALSAQPAEFMLEDFGRAGICLSRAPPRGKALKRAASYIDEDGLNARFEDSLQRRWAEWTMSTGQQSPSGSAFLRQLCLTDIQKNASAEKASPLFERGAQRLADLKAGQAAASESSSQQSRPVLEQQKSNAAVQCRGTTLLDRVLAKQANTASLPAGPTKQQLERKAALHRIVDIAQVLTLLSANKPRASFTLPSLVLQLQQSLRTPVGKEEAERVLELMASEVMPGFVKVLSSGMVKGVVVSRAGAISAEELRERVEHALSC